MIVTVTLNAALDTTYRLATVSWADTNRVEHATARAGGKGINVARVLHALGVDAVVTGFAGGATGRELRADLARSGLRDELVAIAGETRRTVAIVPADGEATTLFNEPGPAVEVEEWDRFCARFAELVAGADGVVLSGSLPQSVPREAYALLGAIGAANGATVVLDADDDALRLGVACAPALAKPNARELTGLGLGQPGDLPAAAEALRDAGAQAVVVSLGSDGLLACTAEGRWRARPGRAEQGNATGAGDAVTAGLVLGLVDGRPWPERLTHAVALGAAAVGSPLAGDFDPGIYAWHLERVTVEEL